MAFKTDNRTKIEFFIATLLILVTASDQQLWADAVVVTKAASSSTIAEIFVEPTEIRIELEIGPRDLEGLMSGLPVDDKGSPAATEQLATLFRNEMQIKTDAGQLLPVRDLTISVSLREVRDEVTGEPLTVQPDDREQVVTVRILYHLESTLPSLTIVPPSQPDTNYPALSIGFVTYHQGVLVNDFRYLPTEATLDLDWEDPWYTRFRHPNLGRQYNAPASVFLYIEPFEVRREIVIRPRDIQEFIDLGLSGRSTIRIDEQEDLKQKVADFLMDKGTVLVDGAKSEGRLDSIHFIHRSLRASGIVTPPQDLDLATATLGVIYAYPTDGLPENVTMAWDLFNDRLQAIPAVASDEAGGLPSQITPENPVLEWQNFLTNPTVPRILDVAAPPQKKNISVPLLSMLAGILLVAYLSVALIRRRKGQPIHPTSIASCAGLLLCGCLLLPFARIDVTNPFSKAVGMTPEEGESVLFCLIHNIYRSFDRHDEQLIYDRLEKSISGDLLTQVYLETRQSMEIRNQGGLKVSVKDVKLEEVSLLKEGDQQYVFHCRWRVSGSVGHWGHIHQRENEHIANVMIAIRNGAWKITNLDMLEQQSVEPLTNAAPAE